MPVELSEIVNNLATPNSSPMSYSSNGQNRAADSNKATGDDLDQEDEGQGCGGGSGKEEAEDKDIKLWVFLHFLDLKSFQIISLLLSSLFLHLIFQRS